MSTTQVNNLHPVQVGASLGAPQTVTNRSATTIYYASHDTVSSAASDGSLTQNQAVTINASTWFAGATEADSEIEVISAGPFEQVEKYFGRKEIVGPTAAQKHTLSVSYNNPAGGFAAGNGSAFNCTSLNVEASAMQLTGHETGKGTLKIGHINSSGTASGDANASAISIDLQAGNEGGTSCQGIFMTSTTTSVSGGAWLTIHKTVGGATQIFRILGEAALEILEQSGAPATPEAGKATLYFEGKQLKFKDSAGVVHVVNTTP